MRTNLRGEKKTHYSWKRRLALWRVKTAMKFCFDASKASKQAEAALMNMHMVSQFVGTWAAWFIYYKWNQKEHDFKALGFKLKNICIVTFSFCTLLGWHWTCWPRPFIHILIWKWGVEEKKNRPRFQTRNCLMYAESWNINNFWMVGVWDLYYRGVSTVWQQHSTKAVQWRPLLVGSSTAAQRNPSPKQKNKSFFLLITSVLWKQNNQWVILLPNWSEIIYFMLKIDINSVREKTDKYESIHFI